MVGLVKTQQSLAADRPTKSKNLLPALSTLSRYKTKIWALGQVWNHEENLLGSRGELKNNRSIKENKTNFVT